jgi:uncharacterized protein (DUF1015 family)
MAQIAPFQGLRFDLSSSQDPAALLAPPYDVISERHREELERRHHRNVVHLDLPRGEGDERYELAGGLLERWIAEGTLRRDERPALYRYEQRFTFANGAGPRAYTRRGFIALLKLEPFSARVVLPHEHTLSGPKLDRLKLMRATRTQFSQVFALYRDPAGEAEALLSSVEGEAPDLDATTSDGVRHRMWAITDPVIIGKVARVMSPKQVMIADGHHRYETMITLRDELRPAERPPSQSLADWGTMFFARAEDPGLLVLPTHRLVSGLPADALASLPERAGRWFTVTEGTEREAHAIEHRLAEEGAARVTFALREAGKPRTLWLGLRPDADLSALGPPALQRLDVTVLHGLLLGPLLGIDAAAMARQSFLSYTHDLDEALGRIDGGEVQGGFLMNATKVEQVLAACEAGFVLPQKSTYFQPKLATGLVMARIDPDAHPHLPE